MRPFPRPEEQADETVIEQIEKVAQRMIALPHPVRDELRVLQRQHALRSGEAEEVDEEARRLTVLDLDRLDLAGGERRRGRRTEMDGLLVRIPVSTDAPALGVQLLQQPHRLEELERVWFSL